MIPAHIQRIQKYGSSFISLDITPSDSSYSWKAGQWVDFAVHLPPNISVAGYSFCSPAGSGTFSLLIRRSNHNVTTWIFSSAKIGDPVFIGPASGTCFYNPKEQDEIVCFAGGIGISPMISMIRTARRLGKKQTLYYSIRASEEDTLRNIFGTEIPPENICIGEKKLSFSSLCTRHPQNTHYFLCGPRNFIDEGILSLEKNNRPNIHFERWW
jgi:nitric oxide dioxygenase